MTLVDQTLEHQWTQHVPCELCDAAAAWRVTRKCCRVHVLFCPEHFGKVMARLQGMCMTRMVIECRLCGASWRGVQVSDLIDWGEL